MKIVACIPFRNEEVFLPICLTSLQGVVDEILGYDDGSTDNSRKIFESFGGIVMGRDNSEGAWATGGEAPIRNLLLGWGRERGATHFLWLDADEALSTNFRTIARQRIAELPPGHKLALQWLALWKSPHMYRDDESVWSNSCRDFAVCDADDLSSLQGFLHLGRTHGENTADNWHRVPLREGAVFHFQFCAWRQFQVKQCWYRCVELVQAPGDFDRINEVYSVTLDSLEERCSPVLPAWVEGLPIPENLVQLPPGWQYGAIVEMFAQHGVPYFEPLQIWHVPELREIFVREVGREPRKAETFLPLAVRMKRALKRVLPPAVLAGLRWVRRSLRGDAVK